MLSIDKVSSNRIDLAFSGKIDSAQMTQVLEELFAAVEDMENGLMLYRIGEFEMPTMGAIGVELKNLPRLFGLIRRIDRVAVVCEQDWIQTWAEIEGKLMPGLEIKSFDGDDEAEAEAWLEA